MADYSDFLNISLEAIDLDENVPTEAEEQALLESDGEDQTQTCPETPTPTTPGSTNCRITTEIIPDVAKPNTLTREFGTQTPCEPWTSAVDVAVCEKSSAPEPTLVERPPTKPTLWSVGSPASWLIANRREEQNSQSRDVHSEGTTPRITIDNPNFARPRIYPTGQGPQVFRRRQRNGPRAMYCLDCRTYSGHDHWHCPNPTGRIFCYRCGNNGVYQKNCLRCKQAKPGRFRR